MSKEKTTKSPVSGIELDDETMDAVAGGMDYNPEGDRNDYWRPGERFHLPAYCPGCGCEHTDWEAGTSITGKVAECTALMHPNVLALEFYKNESGSIERFNGRLLGC